MNGELSERRRLILKLVIQEYIDGSVPISSELLVRKYGLAVSSATIRNELAALEELGYLTHLHTSAGRVPTDAGYRFFVENLMDRTALTLTEQRMIRHQFHQVRTELDQWIQLAGAVLARTAQNASVVTAPRAYQARFKHLELISIHETTVLLVLVLFDGTIRQQTIACDGVRPQDELSRLAARLNDRWADSTVERIRDSVQEREGSDAFEAHVADVVIRSMEWFEDQLNGGIHSDGLMEVLSQPEFAKVARIRQIVEILQRGRGIGPLIPRALASDGVQVVIGGEHGHDDMREYSVVLTRYGIDGEVAGIVGVIGPTRMAYPRAISAVRYIANVMSDLLGVFYNGEGTRY